VEASDTLGMVAFKRRRWNVNSWDTEFGRLKTKIPGLTRGATGLSVAGVMSFDLVANFRSKEYYLRSHALKNN
jgi:hypothetical protein